MSQDELYKYLKEHDVKISRIADEMNIGTSTVSACFNHSRNRYGNPQRFTMDNTIK